MSDVEKLRKAATLMRERAEAATGVTGAGDWWMFLLGADHEADYAVRSSGGLVGHAFAVEASQHIASWHPAVALAVAAWLDVVATALEDVEYHLATGRSWLAPTGLADAVAVAAAYLGDDRG